jgi:hypothetical protein
MVVQFEVLSTHRNIGNCGNLSNNSQCPDSGSNRELPKTSHRRYV